MNKKIMALAVAGAFGAPAAALAQASNVQIFGTVYVEYAYAKQGNSGNAAGALNGELVNIDFLQTPGSEIGFKGEEALGGGTSAWFQCTSTMDVRGSAPQGFCGRNSALGVKGGFGNFFAGNWDMPTKRTAGAVRILSDTGVFGPASCSLTTRPLSTITTARLLSHVVRTIRSSTTRRYSVASRVTSA